MNPEHITWLYIPTAILLGALHGLEPGHSKTMMAAFIIAIRGTFAQAFLLGLSAAISHSLIIWGLAALALHFGSQWNAETAEPYLQLFSAGAILLLAIWMFRRTRSDLHSVHHHHHHHDESVEVDLGHSRVRLEIFEDGILPVFRIKQISGDNLPSASSVSLKTCRADGSVQSFSFVEKEGFLQSDSDIPEPA